MNRLFKFQSIRFLFVGGMNTAFSYSIYATLLYLGVSYVLANLVAFLLGILFSFYTQGRLVFGNIETRRLWRFAGCWCVVWVFNVAFITLLIRVGLNGYWAGAVALAPTVVFSYLMQKYLVFGASAIR